MGLKAVKRDTKRLAWGCQPEEYSRQTLNLAKKKEIEGQSCLTKSKSTIKKA